MVRPQHAGVTGAYRACHGCPLPADVPLENSFLGYEWSNELAAFGADCIVSILDCGTRMTLDGCYMMPTWLVWMTHKVSGATDEAVHEAVLTRLFSSVQFKPGQSQTGLAAEFVLWASST